MIRSIVSGLGVLMLALSLFVFSPATKAKAAECKGLSKTQCTKHDECSYVSSFTRKDGVKVSAFCRNKPGSGKSKAKKPTKKKVAKKLKDDPKAKKPKKPARKSKAKKADDDTQATDNTRKAKKPKKPRKAAKKKAGTGDDTQAAKNAKKAKKPKKPSKKKVKKKVKKTKKKKDKKTK